MEWLIIGSIFICICLVLIIVILAQSLKRHIVDHQTRETAMLNDIRNSSEKVSYLLNENDKLADKTEQLTNDLNNYKDVEKRIEFLTELEEKYTISKEIFNSLVEDVEKLKAQKEGLEREQMVINGSIVQSNGLRAEIETAIEGLREELVRLQQTHSLAVQGGETDNKVEWELSEKEKRVIDIIDKLVDEVPELKEELCKIKWSRIWLPKFQSECRKRGWDKVGGIYLLRVKGRDDLNYVGQAVNIKDRWYTHAKKMLGAESKGNEKLYDIGGPECFTWEVLEEGTEKLNEREKYWIGYWGGLNIKN